MKFITTFVFFNTAFIDTKAAQIISTNPPMNTAPAKKITVPGFIFAGFNSKNLSLKSITEEDK